MKKRLILTLFLFNICFDIFSQKHLLQGFIAERDGPFLSGAQITIAGNNNLSIIFSEPPNAWYRIELSPGVYSVTVEFPTYKPETRQVTIGEKDIFLNIELIPPSKLDFDTLVIGMIYDPPMYWYNEKGDTLGITFELAKLLEKELHKKFIFKIINYSNGVSLLSEGKLSMIMGGFIPSLRAYPKAFLWSLPFIEADYRLITPRGSPIRSIEDFRANQNDLIIGTFAEPAVREWLSVNYPEIDTLQIKSYGSTDWFKCMPAHEVDVIINEYPYAKESMRPFLHQMKMIEEPLNRQNYSIGVAPSDYELLYKIDQVLMKILVSKEYAKIYRKYMDKEFEKPKFNELEFKRTDCRIWPAERTYTTRKGDTLKKIAGQYLGSDGEWVRLYHSNKNLDFIQSPNGDDLLPENKEIRIPIKKENPCD